MRWSRIKGGMSDGPLQGEQLAELLGLNQLSELVGLSTRTLREHIHAPVDPLPAYRVGGRLMVRRSEWERWLSRRRVRAMDANLILDDLFGQS